MKNLYSGFVVFIIHFGFILGFVFIAPKLTVTENTIKLWFSVISGLITILYIYFGSQTIKKENHYLAGVLFYILALITLFLIYMSFIPY